MRNISKVGAQVWLGILMAMIGAGCSASSPEGTSNELIQADEIEIARGVLDKGRDPAVVSIATESGIPCAGALIAPDVVVTARSCAAEAEGPSAERSSKREGGDGRIHALHVWTGEARSGAPAASVKDAFLAQEHKADLVVLLLDRAIEGVVPLDVGDSDREAKGQFVRLVNFGVDGDSGPAVTKLVRDHVAVVDGTKDSFRVAATSKSDGAATVAIDESTGDIVGVASGGRGEMTRFARIDADGSVLDSVAKKSASHHDPRPSHARPAGKGARTKKPASDLGAACGVAADCAGRVCVSANGAKVCSRHCDATDACPSSYRCEKAHTGRSVCVAE